MVVLRKSKLKNGYSFYFDISHKGKRWTEWLKIRVTGDPKSPENKNNIVLAKKMKIERERELVVLGKGLPEEVKVREQDFFPVFDELFGNRKKGAEVYANIRKKIEKFIGKEYLPINAIDKAWLSDYLRFLRDEGLANNTIHQYFWLMGTVLRRAVSKGYIQLNPHQLFERDERPKQKYGAADFLTQEELELFINTPIKKINEEVKQM